jgi:hypothetical protein
MDVAIDLDKRRLEGDREEEGTYVWPYWQYQFLCHTMVLLSLATVRSSPRSLRSLHRLRESSSGGSSTMPSGNTRRAGTPP